MSIRWKTTCWLFIGLALTLGGAGYRIVSQSKASLTAEFDRALLAKVVTLSTFLEEDEDGLELEIDPRALPEFFRSEDPQYFEVGLSRDEIVALSPSLGKSRLSWPPREIVGTMAWNLYLPDGRLGRAVAVRLQAGPIENDGEAVDDHEGFGPPPEPIIVIARDRKPLDEAVASLTHTAFLTGTMALIAVFLVVALALRQGLAPLKRLARQVGSMDVATLSQPLSVHDQPQELQPLSAKLNEFLGRLESSFRRERRMTANMAHELRAPIAEIRSAAEVALKWPDDETLRNDAVEAAAEVSGEMSRVVDALLQLSRAQIGGEAVARVAVDLEFVVEQGIRKLRQRAVDQGISLIEVPAEFMSKMRLLSDAVMLEIVVRNLLDNAISHSLKNARVNSSFERNGTRLTWRLSNGPVSLTEADLEHIWEPLWRKEESRSDRVHVGLGLSLVQALCEYLGLELRNSLKDGTFTMELSGESRFCLSFHRAENSTAAQAQDASAQ